ncbi:MAG: hypothetical protein RIT81_22355 [Deltaproteobacteria bacterium]
MRAAPIHAPMEDAPTSVDPPRIRRVRGARVRPERPPEAEARAGPAFHGVRGDPGNRLARAPLTAVRIREAIALRNHRIDQAERAPPPRAGPARVPIDWVRSRDANQQIRQTGPDRLRILRTGAGRPGPNPRHPHRPVTPLTPAVSVAIDGLVYTVVVTPGATPEATARLLAERLKGRYHVEIREVSASSATVRLEPPILRNADPRRAH